MANALALRADREGLADMSCIVGVGGDVKPILNLAKSGRPLIVVDGCPLNCARQCLKRHNLEASKHFELSKMGAPKKIHEDFDPLMADKIFAQIRPLIEVTSERGYEVKNKSR